MTKAIITGLTSFVTMEQQVDEIIQSLNDFQKLYSDKHEYELVENIKKQFSEL